MDNNVICHSDESVILRRIVFSRLANNSIFLKRADFICCNVIRYIKKKELPKQFLCYLVKVQCLFFPCILSRISKYL